MAARIKKDDRVIVLAGKDKGKEGQVLRVLPKEDRVVVKGVGMIKRHQRAAMGKPAGIVEEEAPIHLSNVAFVDPKTNKATRVGFKILPDGKKVRYAKASGDVIDK